MTIGKEGDIQAFQQLRQLRTAICANTELKEPDVELSMGMSSDYLQAVICQTC